MAGFLLMATLGAGVVGTTTAMWRSRKQRQTFEAEVTELRSETETLSAELTATKTRLDVTANTVAGVLSLDRLEVIKGLTPHHARLLNAAGILTYNDLAQLSAEKIHLMTAGAGGARMDVARWCEEAKRLADSSGALPAWYGVSA